MNRYTGRQGSKEDHHTTTYSNCSPLRYKSPRVEIEFTASGELWAAWFYDKNGDYGWWIDFPADTDHGDTAVFRKSAPGMPIGTATFKEFDFSGPVEPFLDWVMEACPEFTEVIMEITNHG